MRFNLKKLISAVLSAAMTLSVVPAFAEADTKVDTSDITTDVVGTISADDVWDVNIPLVGAEFGDNVDLLAESEVTLNVGAEGTIPADNVQLYIDFNSGYMSFTGSGPMMSVKDTYNTLSPYLSRARTCVDTVYIENGITNIGAYMFSNFDLLSDLDFIPKSVSEINSFAFNDCDGLENIDLSRLTNLQHIRARAFYKCSNLKEVVLPESVINLDAFAFANCASLNSINIPDGITELKLATFSSCTSLNDVFIPRSVREINTAGTIGASSKVFDGCSMDVYVDNYRGSIKGTGYGASTGYRNWGTTGNIYYLHDCEVGLVADQYYFGTPVEPEISVYDVNINSGEKVKLVKDVDYTVFYVNNEGPGTGTANITYIGDYENYVGDANSVDFRIINGLVEDFSISGVSNYTYSGENKEPKPVVKNGETVLAEGVDYTLSYANNTNAGTASVIVTGLGNYQGSKTQNFTIYPCSMSNVSASTIPAQNFTGSEIKVYPEVTFGGVKLQQGVDYDVSFNSNRAVGNASVTLTGKGNFVGSKFLGFKIVSTSNGTWDGPNLYYNYGYAPDSYDSILDSLTLTAPDGTVFRGAEIGDIELKIYRYDEENDYEEEIGCIPDTYSYGDGSLDIEIGDSICAYVYSFNTDNITTEHGFSSSMINSSGNYYTMTVLPNMEDVGNFNILGSNDGMNFDGLDYLSFDYTGEPCEPIVALQVFVGGEGFEMLGNENTFKTYYENNVNAGTATIRLEGLGKIFSGTTTATFEIEPADIANAIIEDVPNKTYTGVAYRPEVSISYNGIDLLEGQDYTLSYLNNTNAGTATITIYGIGNFTGTTTKTFTINPLDIADASFSIADKVSYTGAPLTPEVGVVYGGKVLVEGTDFDVSYSNNNAEGTGYAAVTGKGNYTGTKQLSFEIGPWDPQLGYEPISMDDVSVEVEESFVYDGYKKEPVPTLTYVYENQETGVRIPYTLVEGKDFEIVLPYENNENAGTAKVNVQGLGVFVGTKSGKFDISTANISVATLEAVANQTYSGSSITPDLSLSYNGMDLVKGTDYSVSYSNNENVGTANVSISGLGNYSGTTSTTFAIEAKLLSDDDISTSDVDAQLYTGLAITPMPEVTYNGTVLEKDKDYTLSYENNVNVGTATINIAFIGNYTGSAFTTFQIVPRTISDADVANGNIVISDISAETYSGAAIKPEPKVSLDGVELVKDKDYSLSYENNVNAGTAKVNITFIGNFVGSVAKSFVINPKSGDLITIAPVGDKVFTGSPIMPDIEATDN